MNFSAETISDYIKEPQSPIQVHQKNLNTLSKMIFSKL